MAVTAAAMLPDMTKGELLRTFLEDRGARIYDRAGDQRLRCPFTERHARGDRRPSASVNLTKGRFKCWSCDLSGDVYDLLQVLENLDFVTARRRLGGGQEDVAKEQETWL